MTEELIHVNAFAIFVLLIILGSFKQNSNLKTPLNRTFSLLIFLTLTILLADTVHVAAHLASVFPGSLFVLLSMLVYVIPPAIVLCWLYLTGHFLEQQKPKARWVNALVHLPFAVSVFIAVTSPLSGLYFIVGPENTYARGPLYLLHVAIVYGYLLIAFINIISNRRFLRRDHYFSLLFFAVPPGIVGFIQVVDQSAPFTWAALVLSLLMVYLFVLANRANTDYLTRLFNRREYEKKLHAYIKAAEKHHRFGVALLDLDGFKAINDIYGHGIGDEVLRALARTLKDAFDMPTDTIARVGGDEFAIISLLEKGMRADTMKPRIQSALDTFNKKAHFPFEVHLSVSVLEYDKEKKTDLEHFLKQLDDKLYVHKESKRRV